MRQWLPAEFALACSWLYCIKSIIKRLHPVDQIHSPKVRLQSCMSVGCIDLTEHVQCEEQEVGAASGAANRERRSSGGGRSGGTEAAAAAAAHRQRERGNRCNCQRVRMHACRG